MAIGLIGCIPFPLLYLFSDGLRFITKHLLRYRVAVIKQNLAYVFPDKDQHQRDLIFHEFYKNFIDIILESIKGQSYSPEKLIDRFRLKNPELLEAAHENGQHVIAYSHHYNNWEWGPICLGLQIDHHITGIVKLIANPLINNYMIDQRSRANVSVVQTGHTGKFMSKLPESTRPICVVFIADQRPSGNNKKVKLPFLGSEAFFHKGAGIYAAQLKAPIYTIDVHRVSRGRYEVELVPIVNKNEDLSPEDISERYKAHLEDLILKSPESWLWSHKRFKEFLKY